MYINVYICIHMITVKRTYSISLKVGAVTELLRSNQIKNVNHGFRALTGVLLSLKCKSVAVDSAGPSDCMSSDVCSVAIDRKTVLTGTYVIIPYGALQKLSIIPCIHDNCDLIQKSGFGLTMCGRNPARPH